jgi:beta-galactosidase
MPDPYGVGGENRGSVWQEFLTPETADVVASFDHSYWRFPAITRNTFGRGTLTYEATVVTPALQREIVRGVLKRAGLTGPDQKLPRAVKVRHGRNQQGQLLHYYLNFSGQPQSITYPYRRGTDLLTDRPVRQAEALTLKPWDAAIVAEQTDGATFGATRSGRYDPAHRAP